ncbi:ABC transporter permease [Labrys miyagiensis]|uniref:ABC transporter permease n=1 Tax=Labrys miyagiensis TaxID=346912 RepID=UPI003D66E645
MAEPQAQARRASAWPLVWALALAFALALYLMRDQIPWANAWPESDALPFAPWLSAMMAWLKVNFTWATRAIAAVLDVPLEVTFGLLAKPTKLVLAGTSFMVPTLSWAGVIAAGIIAGHAAGGRRLALLIAACLGYIALFGQWQSAMLSLALIVIAVPLCVIVGLLLGILAWRSPRIEKLAVTPLLDLMQTIPTFAYLIPMLILFGNSPVSAMIATSIFATPPMVRATMVALSRVPAEIGDFAVMAGCTPRQRLWRVLIPTARPMLMVGVNQVIMLALNMVIISSMIGAGGLGYDVLLALRALKIGQGMEAGLAIVVLAIALDRLSQAFASKGGAPVHHAQRSLLARHPHLVLALTVLLLTTLASLVLPVFAKFPPGWTLSTAPWWKAAVDWITVHFFDWIEAFRVALLLYVLNPMRAFCEGFPWLGALVLLALAGYRLGGWRLAGLVGLLVLFCASCGLWEKTMSTVYLCGVSAIIALLIGIPIGVWASRSDRVFGFIEPIVDTLQTLPSFCFIIPIVMLFRVGDVTALIATVSFAIVPAIRYTNHGLRQVPPTLIEAAKTAGCTRRQTFWRVQLPMALPEVLLGLNQTILLSLSMIIICAMIGTRDLGQEVFIALAKADAGRGIVAGLAIAFIGIVADRLIGGASAAARKRLG